MTNLYHALADLLEYPDRDWDDRLDLSRRALASEKPELSPTLDSFCQSVRSLSLSQIQERYTQTFDLNPVCTLDVGYHLFGESYKRGLFLANLRQTEAPYDLNCERQLPDYLPVLLRLLSKLDQGDLRSSLVTDCIIPAIEKMREALAKTESVYESPFAIIAKLLKEEVASQGEFFCHVSDRSVIHV